MNIQAVQTWVADDWRLHSKQQPTVEQQLLYIIEEFGEVAEAIRKMDGRKNRIEKKVDLGSEMADLIISITTLANHFDINLTAEIQKFQVKTAERHKAGH
jgi:NTP pyrophosphatase (non-canonical NTP hydrolase)